MQLVFAAANGSSLMFAAYMLNVCINHTDDYPAPGRGAGV